jgi:hypothetical protein
MKSNGRILSFLLKTTNAFTSYVAPRSVTLRHAEKTADVLIAPCQVSIIPRYPMHRISFLMD